MKVRTVYALSVILILSAVMGGGGRRARIPAHPRVNLWFRFSYPFRR